MKPDTKQSRRRFLKDSALAAGGILSSPILSEITELFPAGIKKQGLLKAVVVGDSAMWGQGLREREKFAYLSVQEIGQLLGREAKIEVNLAHSGAPIHLGRPDCDPACMRRKFVDTYPDLFKSESTSTKRRMNDFIENNNQDRAVLFGEIPSTFPTISYQVKQVDETIAQNAELVLMNGGANDLDFEKFLNPEENRSDFVQHYDPLLEEYTYKRARSLIRQAREKFPRAVLIYTGYFSPFAPGYSNSKVRNLFEYLKGTQRWQVYINKKLFNNLFVDVDQYVLETQHRSQFGLTRSLYWIRKAIAEANADNNLRGPGILFIHPQFTEKNTVFEEDSFFHPYYKVPQIKDPAKSEREKHIVRKEFAEKMQSLLNSLLHIPNLPAPVATMKYVPVSTQMKEKAAALMNILNAPGRLLEALAKLNGSRIISVDYVEVRDALIEELERIKRGRIASFLHPSEKGARRYANVIVKRYRERLHQVNNNNDLIKFNNLTGLNELEKINRILKRYYNLKSHNLNAATFSQLMLVDSIALETVTSMESEKRMFDNIFLNLGGIRCQLNFPYKSKVVYQQGQPKADPSKILGRQFAPGSTDLFTIDGRGMHLSSITEFTISRQIVSPLFLAGKDPWIPTNIKLFINGLEVFNVPFSGNLSRNTNDKLTFQYPYK